MNGQICVYVQSNILKLISMFDDGCSYALSEESDCKSSPCQGFHDTNFCYDVHVMLWQ